MSLGWLPRLALVIAGGALLITAMVIGIAPRLWTAANAHEELPLVLPEFEALAQRTYVYDVYGNEIAVYELENSQPISYADISPEVIEAFLVVEDKEFFSHHGINLRSLVRATLSNFASDAPQQGASTITMQVVKNDFLAGLERDGRYKLLQIHYARMLEREMPKEQILERYLNTVFFGNNAYGIQAAAETYFGKTAAELTFIESAFLAGLVRSPRGSTRSTRRSAAAPAGSRCSTGSCRRGTSPRSRRTDAGRTTFVLPERGRRRSRRGRTCAATSPRHCATICSTRRRCSATPTRSGTTSSSAVACASTRRSTPNLQAQAEVARNELPRNVPGIRCGHRVARLEHRRDPGHGRRARASRPTNARPTWRSGRARPARASSSSSSPRRCRPAPKPGDVIDGTAPCVLPNPGNEAEPFIITDAVSRGVVTLAEQTWASINCAFGRLSQIVGLHRVVDTTYRMAESEFLYQGQPATERDPIEPFASFATGANEMSPLDMASGIQTLANEGLHFKPYFVDYVDDADGQRIYTHLDPGTQVLDPGAALLDRRHPQGRHDAGHGRQLPALRRAARRSARPAPRTATPTPGSRAGRRSCRRRSGWATPTPTPR